MASPASVRSEAGGFSGLGLLEVTAPASCIAAAAQLDACLAKHTVSTTHASENPDDNARSDLWEKDSIFLVFWFFFPEKSYFVFCFLLKMYLVSQKQSVGISFKL